MLVDVEALAEAGAGAEGHGKLARRWSRGVSEHPKVGESKKLRERGEDDADDAGDVELPDSAESMGDAMLDIC